MQDFFLKNPQKQSFSINLINILYSFFILYTESQEGMIFS